MYSTDCEGGTLKRADRLRPAQQQHAKVTSERSRSLPRHYQQSREDISMLFAHANLRFFKLPHEQYSTKFGIKSYSMNVKRLLFLPSGLTSASSNLDLSSATYNYRDLHLI